MPKIQQITPCLWFDGCAEDAAKFYVSIFKNSKILAVTRYGKGGPGPAGSVMTVVFKLNGQKFMGLNGGPMFKFTEAVSFMVSCKTQKEIDHFWKKLSRGGQEIHCGWLKDRFGLSWQIVPEKMREFMTSGQEKSERVMKAIFRMKKIELKVLEKAFSGK